MWEENWSVLIRGKVQGEPRAVRCPGHSALCCCVTPSSPTSSSQPCVLLCLCPPAWKAAPHPTSCQAAVHAPLARPLPSCVVLSLLLSVASWAQLFWLGSYLSSVFLTHHVMSLDSLTCEELKLRALATVLRFGFCLMCAWFAFLQEDVTLS